MPAYSYAILSACLWALSAPIVNIGLTRVPVKQRAACLLTGLVVAQLAGTSVLALLLSVAPGSVTPTLSGYLIAAGVLTFPVATGLYYLAGYAFGARTEFAAQFAKVKPVFSVLLALLVLGEAVSSLSYVSLLFVMLGVAMLIWGAGRGSFSGVALLLGLATATAWAVGEVFMKLGLQASWSAVDTFTALAAATVASVVLFSPALYRVLKQGLLAGGWIGYFAAHGVISFAFAYAAFFESIAVIGLAQTVLINAFWPMLAVGFSCAWRRLRGQPCAVPASLLWAALLILAGSLIQGLALSV